MDKQLTDTGLLLVSRAAKFAAIRHADQRRKGARGEPYINHLAEVAAIVAEATNGHDPALVAAAYLHDTVEDTETTHVELVELFGSDVAELVAGVTDNKSLPKPERKQRQIDKAPALSDRAKQLKIADKISNLNSLLVSPPTAWSHDRVSDYARWAEAVVAGCRGVDSSLDSAFDDVLAKFWKTYRAS